MHRIFREALKDARGESQFVVAVMIDIRGFSAFSKEVESPETAMFIKRVYMELIDSYFPFASFYKSTGDGLLLITPWDENNLAEVSQKVIASCVNCHSEFGNICRGDPVIYFKVPNRIGIGVARGTACCLLSGNRTIDYSGRLLNLTSRLCDLARPSGIVIDGAFDISLLNDEQRTIFHEDDEVYLRGIAEAKAIKIHFTPKFTVIPRYNKQPIGAERWRRVTDTRPYSELLKIGTPVRYTLPSEALSPDDVQVRAEHASIVDGKPQAEAVTVHILDAFQYKLEQGEPSVFVDAPKLCELLKREQVTKGMNVTISVGYVEK